MLRVRANKGPTVPTGQQDAAAAPQVDAASQVAPAPASPPSSVDHVTYSPEDEKRQIGHVDSPAKRFRPAPLGLKRVSRPPAMSDFETF